MPYVRPATMTIRMSTNGTTSLLDESRFYSSAGTSVTADAESSTQNEDHISNHGLMNGSSTQQWQHDVSASFAQLAVQFQTASQNIAAIQTATQTSEPLLLAFTERLEAIEEEQQRLAGAIEVLREQFGTISRGSPPGSTVNDVEPIVPSGPTISDLEALLKAQQEAFKLDQEQLPAKLQNALAVKSLSPIRMPPMKNRKQPINSPATRGEFEHLTRERYEAMLQSYGIPFSGDINAKRELLRAFLGIPNLPLDKK